MKFANLFWAIALVLIFVLTPLLPQSSQNVLAADPNCSDNAPSFQGFLSGGHTQIQITSGQNLQAQLNPPQIAPDPSRNVVYLWQIRGAANWNTINPNNPPSGWVIDLGTPSSSGSLELDIQFKSSSSSTRISQMCFNPSFTVCPASGCSTGTGSGTGSDTNPCAGGTCQTALGPISTNFQDFAGTILSIAIGLAGGVALIFMVIGSIRVIFSSGDQQKLNGGREQIIAAVAGLLFLVFSTLILRFIGIQIIGL